MLRLQFVKVQQRNERDGVRYHSDLQQLRDETDESRSGRDLIWAEWGRLVSRIYKGIVIDKRATGRSLGEPYPNHHLGYMISYIHASIIT